MVQLCRERGLDDFLGDIRSRLAWMPIADFRHDPARNRSFDIAAHWALYVENYLEGLHIPFIHPALNQVLSLDGYGYELQRYANLQFARAREGVQPASLETPPGGEPGGAVVLEEREPLVTGGQQANAHEGGA